MAQLNGSKAWIAIIVSVAIACIGFAYGVASNGVGKVEADLAGACTRLRAVEQDSASLKAMLPKIEKDIDEIKADIKKLLER